MTQDNPARHSRPDDRNPVKPVAAQGVETVVVPEKGQWACDIIVFFPDGVVRRRIGTYRTEKLAQISARCIKRGAERDISGPING